jgi:hypothetical protein
MIEISFEEHERRLAQRKAELGLKGRRDHVPVNSGAHRTPEKRELLRAIQDEAQAQGRAPRFRANF